MKKAYEGGVLFVLLGTSMADSSNIILPFSFLAIGIILIGVQLCTQQEHCS